MDVLSTLTTILGIAGIAGAAAGFFRASRGETTIKLQGEEITYYKDKVARLESDVTSVTADRDRLSQTNTELLSHVQGSPQLIELTKEIKSLVEVIKSR